MDIFKYQDKLIADYSAYVTGFLNINDERIRTKVYDEIEHGTMWPEPLIQLNPSFLRGASIEELVRDKVLHKDCFEIFRRKNLPNDFGTPLELHKHQEDAIRTAQTGGSYILSTGTGSGKSLTYIIPLVNRILTEGSGNGIKGIIVYPMNALANSQEHELEKFLKYGFPEGREKVRYAKYTGQEKNESREAILRNPPDILLTNYVMLELIMTRTEERELRRAAQGLQFLVLDELHTYRGRQGADVAMLVRRIRNLFSDDRLQCVGTSATLSTGGTLQDRKNAIAKVGSMLFGTEIKPGNVITETLTESTHISRLTETGFPDSLKEAVLGSVPMPETYEQFLDYPLSIWIESTIGIEEAVTGTVLEAGISAPKQWQRKKPMRIGGEGLAKLLAEQTGAPAGLCETRLQETLITGNTIVNPKNGFPVFAFRLHQFISKGDTVYATIEKEEERYITTGAKYYAPDDGSKILLPLAFCRECGQEFYTVFRTGPDNAPEAFVPRGASETASPEDQKPGFLFLDTENPIPEFDTEEFDSRFPEDWFEEKKTGKRQKASRKEWFPSVHTITSDGLITENSEDAVRVHFFKTPFRFCPNCRVEYNARQKSDFSKLATLSSEGRSTATTVLTLSAFLSLKNEDLEAHAKKILSFTDDRQDASLQAGHFNDFVNTTLLRGAIFSAAQKAGENGLRFEELAKTVFDALRLEKELYLQNPQLKYQPLESANRAFRDVLGYRIYQDLRRGWRVNQPNLEQCGLLRIHYPSLSEICSAEEEWAGTDPFLKEMDPKQREEICTALLNHLRKELIIDVLYLNADDQERIKNAGGQYLIDPWRIEDSEIMEPAGLAFPGSKEDDASDPKQRNLYVSARSGFGMFLRKSSGYPKNGTLEQAAAMIKQLFEVLVVAGLVKSFQADEKTGYRLDAAGFVWKAGDGTVVPSDPIRVKLPKDHQSKTNQFFTDFYRNKALSLRAIEAREHTAQVNDTDRQDREKRFGEASLPVLFCSPTMELGVDIKDLNVVNMRNVPPTPANYAQRSGRAGRSGKPALVFTYCSSGSPHDQYFFARQELMAAGEVTPPRLDLTNEDLLRSHINALWLTESDLPLKSTLKDVLQLDKAGEPLQDTIASAFQNDRTKNRVQRRAVDILGSVRASLPEGITFRFDEKWLLQILEGIGKQFDDACNRWRNLYRAAVTQQAVHNAVMTDVNRPAADKDNSERLRREAEAQIRILTENDNQRQSDFYSYRYFAGEGFLPGYNFPRLPLSAFIPARRIKREDKDPNFLSRPRFLALSEYGPRALVYHEGARFRIHRVLLPPDEKSEGKVSTIAVFRCERCGYVHPDKEDRMRDLCEQCGTALPAQPFADLLKMQNVATKRVDRITSDEEERTRFGYEIITGYRFPGRTDAPRFSTGLLRNGGTKLGGVKYASAAEIWRINLGWLLRKKDTKPGFVLDTERGYWGKNDSAPDETDDPMSSKTIRVIPYVEDFKNMLLFEPDQSFAKANAADADAVISLAYALKHAIQAVYELEDMELSLEILPDTNNPKQFLFYEAAEGGAGVLRQILDSAGAVSRVAVKALELLHFDPVTFEDKRRAPHAHEDCSKACYDCLMSYRNQRVHRKLNRKSTLPFLTAFAAASLHTSPAESNRTEHFEMLFSRCDSLLEKKWLTEVFTRGLRLPDSAQQRIDQFLVQPDFTYNLKDFTALIFIDGTPHDTESARQHDTSLDERLTDAGYKTLRFRYDAAWDALFNRYQSIFGNVT